MAAVITFKILFVCFYVLLYSVFVSGQSLSDSIELMDTMLSEYDRRHRPVTDQSEPINVNVSFDLVTIRDFDEVEEKFSVVGILYLTWFDEVIKWTPWKYGGLISQMFPLYDVWYPIIVLSNPYDNIADVADTDWMTVRIFANGFAILAPGAVFRSTCGVDVTFYPFDTQVCRLYFVPWGYDVSEVTLTTSSEKVLQTYYTENGEWSLVDSAIGIIPKTNTVVVTFVFERQPMFLVINVILPILLMSIINVLVFMLPPQSGERVSYAVTVLLALAVFLSIVRDNLPKTSKPLAILSFYLMFILIISLSICVAVIFNLNLYFRSKKKPVPGWCLFIERLLQCARCRKTKFDKNIITPIRPLDIHVVDLDNSTSGKTNEFGVTDQQTHDNDKVKPEPEVTCTWKEVSSAVDKLCFVLFSVAIITVNIYFIVAMINR